MAKLVVLSNAPQYEQFLSKGLHPQDFIVYCDNEKFYDFLKNKNINFIPLDEFLIRDQWNDINAWACARAAAFGRNEKLFPLYDFPSVIYLPFSLILPMMLKNHAYADYLIEKHYRPINRPMRACQPRDLLLQVRNFCMYHNLPKVMSPQAFDFACENYFSIM